MRFKIVNNKSRFFAVSILLVMIGIVAMLINGVRGNGVFNLDIDFTGGTAIVMDMEYDFDNNELSQVVTDITGQVSPQVQKIIGTNQVSIKIQSIDETTRYSLITAISEKFDIPATNVLSISDLSGTVSKEMQKTSVIAVLVACLVMLIYISIRFQDFKMGISSIIALLHDVFMMLSFYAIFRIPVNTAFIAALLTVVGYSINATIVIFDRIRENRKLEEVNDYANLIDISVWQTMRRSVYTSLTTFFTIGALCIFGVEAVRQFALPIVVGIVSGVYSSIFLSGSLWYVLYSKMGDKNYDDYYEHESEKSVIDPFAFKNPKDYK